MPLYVCYVTIEFHDIVVNAETEEDARELAEEEAFRMLEDGVDPHDVFVECVPID